jgi:hypothetical protein
MGPEKMGGMNPDGRGHEIRQEKQVILDAIRQPFLEVLKKHEQSLSEEKQNEKMKENWVYDITRLTRLLCLEPEQINIPRKQVIEDLVHTSIGAANLFREGDPQRAAVYEAASTALQEAVEVYRKNGGEIQFDFSAQPE